MAQEKTYRTNQAVKLINIDKRKLALWENTYKLFKISRNLNSATGTQDRVFTEDDIKLLKWVKRQLEDGYAIDTVRILIEYFSQGKIELVKWYK